MSLRNAWMLFFVGVCIVGVGGLLVLSRMQKSPRVAPSPEPLTQETQDFTTEHSFVEVPIITPVDETSTDQGKQLTINIQYPKVSLLQHPTLAKEANDVIAAFVTNVKNEFQKDVDEILVSTLQSDLTSDLTMRYTPLLLSPTIISIRFDASEYIAGAAHPNNFVRVLNYNMAKHLLLSPTDLFASSTQALPFLSTHSRTALRTRFTEMTEEGLARQMVLGTEPTHENFQEIGVTKTGLIVLFAPYQVAPYARGVLEVKIPLTDMSPQNNSDSLLTRDVQDAIRMATANIVEATPAE